MATRWAILLVFLISSGAWAAPVTNPSPNGRRIPPPGIAVPAADRAELEAGGGAPGPEIESLRSALPGRPSLLEFRTGSQNLQNAARYPLNYKEFYQARESRADKSA